MLHFEEIKNITSPLGQKKLNDTLRDLWNKTTQISTKDILNGAVIGDKLREDTIEARHIKANAINADHIEADQIRGRHIHAGEIDTQHLKALSIKADNIDIDAITTKHIKAGSITAESGILADLSVTSAKIAQAAIKSAHIDNAQIKTAHIDDAQITSAKIADAQILSAHIDAAQIKSAHIEQGSINTAHIMDGAINSAKILEGSIGTAHISELSADLLTSGTIDTGAITIRDETGRMIIANNKLQVFDYTNDDTPVLYERIALGHLEGEKYGLVVRGSDGNTILLNENGITEEGFTDGYSKLPDNSLNPIKIDIDSVITRINEDGTSTIEGSKILLNNKTLDVEIFDINTKQSELETITSNNTASITANTEAINLKLDSQIFDNYKTETDGEIDSINTNLQTKTTEISALQGQIVLKAEQSDLETLETITNGISSNVDSLQTQTAGIEIELGSIESRVSDAETDISNLNTRVAINETSISQNTTEIELRVTATEMEEIIETVREDINELSGETGGRISLIESEILVHADEISLSVKKDDITHKNIWGINYVSNLPENWEQGFNDGVNVDTNPYYISNIGFINVNPNTDYTLFIENLVIGTTWEELSLMTWAEVAQNTWGSYLLGNVRNCKINITEYDANDNILNETWEGIEFIFNKDTPYPVSFTTQEGTEKIKMRIKAQGVGGLELEINPAAVEHSNLKLEIGTRKTDWLPCINDIAGEHQLNAINYEEEPIEPVAGTLWLDAQNNINLYKFDGVEWVLVGFGTVENIMTKISSNEAQLKILDDKVNIEISSLKEGQEEINTYFSFEEDGLKIGKSDSPFNVGISHERFEINKDYVPIVWISGQQEKLFIKSVEVTEDLIVGNHAIEKYDENLTLVRWIGGDA